MLTGACAAFYWLLPGRRERRGWRAATVWDHFRRFADVATSRGKLSARTLVLDGEVAIYDQQLRSRFEWLRETDPVVGTPPLFMAFDLLYYERSRSGASHPTA